MRLPLRVDKVQPGAECLEEHNIDILVCPSGAEAEPIVANLADGGDEADVLEAVLPAGSPILAVPLAVISGIAVIAAFIYEDALPRVKQLYQVTSILIT